MDIDRPTLAGLWETHGPSLHRIAASYAPPGPDRADLVQEIALAIVRALPRFRGDSAVQTYVYRIAHNKGVDHLLRRRLPDAAEALVDHTPCPAALAASADGEARILSAIRALPLGPRQVLTLALEGLTNAEIAAVLGLTPNHVAVRLHRGRTALRQTLEALDGR